MSISAVRFTMIICCKLRSEKVWDWQPLCIKLLKTQLTNLLTRGFPCLCKPTGGHLSVLFFSLNWRIKALSSTITGKSAAENKSNMRTSSGEMILMETAIEFTQLQKTCCRYVFQSVRASRGTNESPWTSIVFRRWQKLHGWISQNKMICMNWYLGF